jgi:uroporphyrinogen decarboxylase
VQAALSLEPADRPPVAWWGHTFREEWSPEELAAVTLERARRYRWDFVKLQPRASCFAEAFGSEYRPSGDPHVAPVLVRPGVEEVGDWRRLPSVDAGVAPLKDQVTALARVAAELGDEVPVIQTVFSPLTVAGHLVGKDPARVVQELQAHPEVLVPALERIAAALSDFSQRSVEAGAAGIFYAISGYAGTGGLPWPRYEEWALPSDRLVVGSVPASSWFNVLHLCGPGVHLEVAGALRPAAVSWSVHDAGNPTLLEGRDRLGRAAMGGFSHKGTLLHGTPDEVLDEARAATAGPAGSDDRGVILAPGCSVPPEARKENLEAVASLSPR